MTRQTESLTNKVRFLLFANGAKEWFMRNTILLLRAVGPDSFTLLES